MTIASVAGDFLILKIRGVSIVAYQIPRGTYDILPGEVEKWQWVEEQMRHACRLFHYEEVRTPMFEQTELYKRGVGETTDIVEKEMYSFSDRGNRQLTLRPEGTAGMVRSFVEHKIYGQPQPTKWYYIGPMFRYERPQAGRSRQFHQFGIEAFGSMDPALDAEVIALGMHLFQSLGLEGVRVELNSVGDAESRARYREKLIQYFEPYKDELSPEAQSRLYKNPLRILDSKDARTKEIASAAPSLFDDLSEDSKMHLDRVKQYLDEMGVHYVINDRLVRGLDYYTQTAFEYMLDLKGAQASTIGGGGRYNGLVKEIGGDDVPGVGFGIGIERVMLALEEQQIQVPNQNRLDGYLITMGEQAKAAGMKVLQVLREAGFQVDRDYLDRKMKAQFKAADRAGARYVFILGEEEIAENKIKVKSMATQSQEEVSLSNLLDWLKEKA
nr:histidine--tRNA ligase [Polycladospora coralii]